MLYAVLCYAPEGVVGALGPREESALLARLAVVNKELAAEGKLGAHGRLMPTTAATTLRHGAETVVLDGPFAETKEQLLGFYVLDCATLDDAIDAARRLIVDRHAIVGAGALEIRPFHSFTPGEGAVG